MAMVLPTIPSEFPCPGGDIFDLPTRSDLTNAINEIAQVPSKLKAYMVGLGDDLTAEIKEQIEEIISTIETLMEGIGDILSPYWKKGQIRNWQKEAKDAIQELLQEFHIYIPVKVMELIGKIIPVSFTVNLLGISIDVLKIITPKEQEKIKKQIEENIDKFYKLVPEVYRTFDGSYGLDVDEYKAKITWQYLKSEIMDWITNSVAKLFEELIDKFKDIWKALKLPAIPLPLFDFDLEGILKGIIDSAKAKFKDAPEKFRQEVKDKLLGLEIAGFKLKSIIGGTIDETVLSIEDQINEFINDLRDFKINWKKKLLFDWVKIIKKFLDAIGLGAIFDVIAITFCDLLKLIGFPFKIDITIPQEV